MSELATTTDITPAAPPALLPVYDQLPFSPVRGQGVWLWDAAGRRVLDLWGGHAVALLGHGHPRLLGTLHDQAAALMFQSNALPLAIREQAAARLAAFAPAGLARVFFVNSGAEANENALLLALRATGRQRVVAVEGAFHGRTAAAAAVSWGKHRHAFPRPPFDVTFVPRGDQAALAAALGNDVAAFIAEPVQGVAGAYDLGRDYLLAARELTRSAGALLVLDEVQTGIGRTGYPFAAQLYGVTPDLLTVAKGLAGGFPAGAVLGTNEATAGVGSGELGSTFGGGPLACAMILAVLDAIAQEGLLERVRAVSAHLREVCQVGPVVGVQGAGLLVGLRTAPPARQVMMALLARGILTGTSADPHVLRLLPPLVLRTEHVDLLAGALKEIAAGVDPMKHFVSLAELPSEEVLDLLALATRLERQPDPQALAGRVLALLFFNPSLRTLASFQSAMARLGGSSFVISPGQGSWQLETRRGVVMNGDAAEHVREAVPVLASYADALGIRAFAGGRDLAADLADTNFRTMASVCPVPLINLESAIDHPCQALADWKTMDDLEVPRHGRFVLSWANHPKPLPLAVPAAALHMAAARGMEVVVARPHGYGLPAPLMERARAAAQLAGGSVRETNDPGEAMVGARVVYAKSWASPELYGDAQAEGIRRRALTGWCVDEHWFDEAAPECRFMHCLPVRRNVVVTDAVLDGPRSVVVHEARNRMWVQMAVLHRLLAGTRRGLEPVAAGAAAAVAAAEERTP